MKQKLILLLTVLLCLSAGTYAQSDSLCYGHTSTAPSCADSFVTNYPGGSWASSDTTVAVVNPETGEVTPVSGGTTDIAYTFANGCGKYHYSYTVTIIKPTLTGTDSICIGSTTTFVASPSGGTWVSGNTAVATVGTSGVVTGVAAGSSIITYTSPQGCESTKAVYVSAPFSVAICETAPIAICDSVVTYCTGLTLKVSGAPAGAAYSWSGSIPATLSYDGSDAVFTFTASPTAGYYTVTATYGGCSATQRIRILVASGSCEPCSAFKPACSGCDTVLPFITLRTSTLTSANVSTTIPQNYFIASPGGNVRLNVSPAPGSVFYIDKSVQMFVAVGDSVVLDSCHMFATTSCQWYGIIVNTTSSSFGKIVVKNNTLIEHVATGGTTGAPSGGAISVTGTGLSGPTTSGKIIDINGGIFNANNIGLHIESFVVQSLPFEIINSIYTNRTFCNYDSRNGSGCRSKYPYSWPTIDYLKQVDSGGYYPKYRLDSFAVNSNYLTAGIYIYKVGYCDSLVSPFFYYPLKIGDSQEALNSNVFDNIGKDDFSHAAIWVRQSSARVYNCVFRSCNRGVWGDAANTNQTAVAVLPGNDSSIANYFYDCRVGIYNGNIRQSVIKGIKITGRNKYISPTVINDHAQYGIYINNGGTISGDTVVIEKDSITNVKVGINLDGNATPGCVGKYMVRDNVLIGTSGMSGTEYMWRGIYAESRTACTSGQFSIKNNKIYGVTQYGIIYSSLATGEIDSNTVVIRNNGSSQIVGINVSRESLLCTGSPNYNVKSVSYNHVYGDTTSGVTYDNSEMSYSTASRTYDGYKGLQFQRSGSNTNHSDVLNNYVHDLGIGFNFEDTNYVNWSSNTMSRLQIGMALQSRYCSGGYYRALIGLQGDTCTPSDNIWIADSTSWPGWGHTNASGDTIWQTFVSNDTPAVNTSILFVRDSVATKPTANGSNNDSSYAYSFADGSLVLAHKCTGSRMSTTSSGSDMQLMQAAEANSYRLYPNPNDGRFTVQRTETTDEAVMAEVVNMTGQKVFEGSLNFRKGQASLDLQKRAPGVYLLRMVKSKGSVETLRFVVD